MSDITVISHRGRSCGEESATPGNTLQAFEECLGTCPNVPVEMDVRLTWGGLLVVAHDYLLERFSNGKGPVNQIKSRDELQLLRINGRGRRTTEHAIPELEEVLRLFAGRGTIHLELKYGPGDPPGLLDAVLKVLAKHWNQDIHISSFNHAALRAVSPYLPIGILSNSMPPDPAAYIRQFTT